MRLPPSPAAVLGLACLIPWGDPPKPGHPPTEDERRANATEVVPSPLKGPVPHAFPIKATDLGNKELRQLLATPTDKLKTGIDKGTPLKDALDFICRSHPRPDGLPLTYRFDYAAFAMAGAPDIEEKPIELPPMMRLPLGTILDDVLARIDPIEAMGTYLVVNGRLEIVPRPKPETLFARRVSAEFTKRPLQTVVQELTDQTGVVVLLDPTIKAQALEAVSGLFVRTPLRTVVRILARQAALEVVPLDNVLYLTDHATAEALKKDPDLGRKAIPDAEHPGLPGEGP
jgi:hypothetical protein